MALEDKSVPYEILIRFDPEGRLQGAHKIERRIVALDGEVLKDEPGDAQPLDVGPDGTLWGVLDQAQIVALATATELREEMVRDKSTIDDLRGMMAIAQDTIKELKKANA
jgi:hypothetical protein